MGRYRALERNSKANAAVAMLKRIARNTMGEISLSADCTSTKVEPQIRVLPARAASARQVRTAFGRFAGKEKPLAFRRHAEGGPICGSRSSRLSVRKMRLSPRSRPSGLYHSLGVWAPPPCPPAPMETAGMPSESGILASVEEQSRCERMPR